MTTSTKQKQYIYIVQAALEPSKCKIGKINDLERRLKEYNSTTGVSKDNRYKYLFTCEVKDMAHIEDDIKYAFKRLREQNSREIYFYNNDLFGDYVEYIKKHNQFIKEVFIQTDDSKKQEVKIVKKVTPSLEERGVTRKELLQKAQGRKDKASGEKREVNDEYYTRYEDIEKEISMYDKKIWKGKTVFCNCDDAVGNSEARTSAFALFFIKNFQELELEKLICTHYGGPVDLFNAGTKGYIFTKYGFSELETEKEFPEGYDGSFNHPLSLKILKEDADIVCTNPPFSKTPEYWDIIVKSKKKFLIISNVAVILTSAYVPHFYNKKVWAGYNEVDWFQNQKRELTRAAGHWYTNFPIKNRPKYKQLKFVPLKEIPEKHKKYDDAKMLLVDNCYIPSDYKKPFAVSTRPILNGLLEKGYELIKDKEYYPYTNGKKNFARVLVQKI